MFLFLTAFLACGGSQPEDKAPHVAVSKMTAAEGLCVKLVASEPEVRQPILVKCDERGRLWVIQYLQYPNPAGLKRVKVDRWSRTVYDRVPDPPPHGPRGDDRITILEDVDGDGRADRFKDFASGLNLATGLAFGNGGVYVLQVPYLLFYPDRDRDDVPDADPGVVLAGFGMEDAQSLANHLTWGPDGWLYGVNGSTTTCRIRGIEFQQGCWRYHPPTDRFELFCEGGGNTFGLTFDEHGKLFYSTNGGPFVHGVQGAYYVKSFGKHGPLHNLYAYGYFSLVQRDSVPGGPPTGGTIYLGDSFPDRFRGTFIAGNFLGHTASWWDIAPLGSTVEARLGGTLLDSHDTWFGPTDMCLAPDGSMYICDFYDQRTAHPDPDANWDRSNGRVYKIECAGTKPVAGLDLAALSSRQLVELLGHENRWYADMARRLLADRQDATVAANLRELALQRADAHLALQGLWALHAVDGLDDRTAGKLLSHADPYVREWTVRLLGDRCQVSPKLARRLAELAATDSSVTVRSQLAATARRLPVNDGLPIVEQILQRDLDRDDPHIPLLLWWAIESKTMTDGELVLDRFARREAWQNPSNRDQLRRLLRRYAAAGSRQGYRACLRLLTAAPAGELDSMHEALALGLAERSSTLSQVDGGGLFERFARIDASAAGPAVKVMDGTYEPLTPELGEYIAAHWKSEPSNPFWLRLAIRGGLETAYEHLLAVLAEERLEPGTAEDLLQVLAELGRSDCTPAVLKFLDASWPAGVQSAAIDVLARFGTAAFTERLLAIYSSLSAELQSKSRDVLFSRTESARQFLTLVDAAKIDADEVPVEQLRRISLLDDEELAGLVRKHWGNVQPGTAEEKLAAMRRFSNDLRAGAGDAGRGKQLFQKHCATCHQLFGEGNQVGPELTKANRGDREALLANLVDPSAVIRREYMSYVLNTTAGQVLTGLIAEQDGASLTLLDAKNQRIRISRNEIDEIEESPVSLMPEKILEQLDPQELRDLFSYLQGEGG